jgi:hypothetical protein
VKADPRRSAEEDCGMRGQEMRARIAASGEVSIRGGMRKRNAGCGGRPGAEYGKGMPGAGEELRCEMDAGGGDVGL